MLPIQAIVQPKMNTTENHGLQRLEKQIKAGKLTKSNVVNKSYEKYLKMQGNVNIEIDYEKYHAFKF
jgi:hypothetical protein